MTAEQRITEVLAEHTGIWWTDTPAGYACDGCNRHGPRWPDRFSFNAHVTAEIVKSEAAARRIDTVEQLDALPFLSVVREIRKPAPSGNDYGSIWERQNGGWVCISGLVGFDSKTGPSVPATVLWTPEEADHA